LNLPSPQSWSMIADACARRNLSLYYIASPARPERWKGCHAPGRAESGLAHPPGAQWHLNPVEAQLCGTGNERAPRQAQPAVATAPHGQWAACAAGSLPSRREHCDPGAHDATRAARAACGGVCGRSPLVDWTGQTRFYRSNETRLVRRWVDVAILWPPRRRYGALPDRNRPATRMHYAMALGIPVIGFPMPAYVEAAQRLGYPAELLQLRTSADIELALCALGATLAGARRCSFLNTLAKGAELASPLNSALELLALSCRIAAAAGRALRRHGDLRPRPSEQTPRQVLGK